MRRLSTSSHPAEPFRKNRRHQTGAGIPVHDNQRKLDVLEYVMKLSKANHINPVPIKAIFETLIAMNEKAQRAALEKPMPKKNSP